MACALSPLVFHPVVAIDFRRLLSNVLGGDVRNVDRLRWWNVHAERIPHVRARGSVFSCKKQTYMYMAFYEAQPGPS